MNNINVALMTQKLNIMSTTAFRRLANKTQVFHNPTGSNGHLYRTRLTHSNEVAAIASIVATQLGLNPILAEILGLAHDIGHPCFGHVGQDALQEAMFRHTSGQETFEHNNQAIRILTALESTTRDTIDPMIVNGLRKREEHGLMTPCNYGESQVMDVSDMLAYLTSDIQDALNVDFLKLDDVLALPLLQRMAKSPYWTNEIDDNHNIMMSQMRQFLLSDLVCNSQTNMLKYGLETSADFQHLEQMSIAFSDDVHAEVKQTLQFMYDNVYLSASLQEVRQEAKVILNNLFDHYMVDDNYKKLGDSAVARYENGINSKARVIADWLSGCDDKFAYSLHKQIFPDYQLIG